MPSRNRYTLYQAAVQDPQADVELYEEMYTDLRGEKPHFVREDFCAGFAFSCAWVKHHSTNRALCLDLDPEPLAYGRAHNLKKLFPSERKRLTILQKNVVSVTRPQVDFIMAGNFSFNFLKERQTILEYFKCARQSLRQNGLLFLELAGGPDFISQGREQRQVAARRNFKFTYYWDQQSFDPITHYARYAIHFRFKDGSWMKNAFTYDWRLWSIPEVRDAMKDAGFSRTHVFWEKVVRGEETGEYSLADQSKNREFWLGYVVGEK